MKKLSRAWSLHMAAAAFCSQWCCTPAYADVPPETPSAAEPQHSTNDQIVEIMVTAQKMARSESLQKVPLAITAINMATIEQANITDLEGVGRLAPNVELQAASVYPGFANFTIRGIGVNGSLQSLDSAVSISYDGVPYTFNLGTILDTFDVESIEVMRGPQGVLFGRNATGGAVALRTRRPKDTFESDFTLRVGNFGRIDETASVEGPLTSNVQAKIAIAHRKADGSFEDNNGGTTVPARLNPSGIDNSVRTAQVGEDTWMIRPIVVFEPTSDIELTLVQEYIDGHSGGSDSRVKDFTPNLSSTTGFGYTPPPYGNTINLDSNQFANFTSYRVSLEGDWKLHGVGVVTSVTGFRRADELSLIDADGTPFPINILPGEEQDNQFSEELRFASDFSSLYRFVVGGYYSKTNQDVDSRRQSMNTQTGATTYTRGLAFQKSEDAAFFANFDWMPIDRLTLSAGARFTHEDKDLHASLRAAACTGGASYTGCQENVFYDLSKSWNDVSPRVAANFQLTPDLMTYVSWTKGFRSGAFNIRANVPAGLGPTAPETASTYEVGLKSTWWDGRARLNLAAFHTDYDNIIEVLTVGFVQDILNAAKATIQGVELEGELHPGAGFAITTSVGLTDAYYRSFDLNQDGVSTPAETALKFARVPKWTATIAANKEIDVPSAGKFNLRVGYSYRTSTFADVQNTPSLEQGSYGLLDASVDFKPNDRWQLSLYGHNLTNVNYYDYGTRFASSTLSIGDVVFGGAPRTYGLEAQLHFR
jgi:iron complex outermembrane recepter protein